MTEIIDIKLRKVKTIFDDKTQTEQLWLSESS